MKQVDKVLVLAPHTDDGEIGCGGTLNRFIKEGKEVYYVAFSIARKSSKARGYPEDILAKEVKNATKELGIEKDNLIIKDYPVRNFPKYRQEILDDMIKVKQKLKPDLIFMPTQEDIHQDHSVIVEEGIRAFKRKIILGYEEPWNQITNKNNFFIKLNNEDIEKKILSLKQYESQFGRGYIDENYIWSLAKTRGVQINHEYAECFELIRYIY
ncbi:MAG: PIG-L deacetylase family protein [Halanaerobiales bacterium]